MSCSTVPPPWQAIPRQNRRYVEDAAELFVTVAADLAEGLIGGFLSTFDASLVVAVSCASGRINYYNVYRSQWALQKLSSTSAPQHEAPALT